MKSGASLDPVAEDETPFLGAIKWSRFTAAERLLRHGANVNFRSKDGQTPLDLVARRRDKTYFRLLSGKGGAARQ